MIRVSAPSALAKKRMKRTDGLPGLAGGQASGWLALFSPALAFEQQLPQALAVRGLPVLSDNVVRWRAKNSDPQRPPVHPTLSGALLVCVDGSGLLPKNTLLRTVAWATAWLDKDGWHTCSLALSLCHAVKLVRSWRGSLA